MDERCPPAEPPERKSVEGSAPYSCPCSRIHAITLLTSMRWSKKVAWGRRLAPRFSVRDAANSRHAERPKHERHEDDAGERRSLPDAVDQARTGGLTPAGSESVAQRPLDDGSLPRTAPRDDQETEHHEQCQTEHYQSGPRLELPLSVGMDRRANDQEDEGKRRLVVCGCEAVGETGNQPGRRGAMSVSATKAPKMSTPMREPYGIDPTLARPIRPVR
jgi:hypothetical protein